MYSRRGGGGALNRKCDGNDCIICFKACWVVSGNHQTKGLHYRNTHASVGTKDSLHTLFAVAASLGMQVCQFDIVTAILNG